jgi:hypothetical protein
MYSLPSASQMRQPLPRTMYGGSPPTDLKARTGESTPPGITRDARACSSWDLVRGFIGSLEYTTSSYVASLQTAYRSIDSSTYFGSFCSGLGAQVGLVLVLKQPRVLPSQWAMDQDEWRRIILKLIRVYSRNSRLDFNGFCRVSSRRAALCRSRSIDRRDKIALFVEITEYSPSRHTVKGLFFLTLISLISSVSFAQQSSRLPDNK